MAKRIVSIRDTTVLMVKRIIEKPRKTVAKQAEGCDLCDFVRQIFPLIEKCFKKNTVEINVAKSVRVDPVFGAQPK